jgi:hypothetical protein
LMQDAATEIGALRSRAHDLAAAIQEHDSLDECARCQAALAAFDLLLIDGLAPHAKNEIEA